MLKCYFNLMYLYIKKFNFSFFCVIAQNKTCFLILFYIILTKYLFQINILKILILYKFYIRGGYSIRRLLSILNSTHFYCNVRIEILNFS